MYIHIYIYIINTIHSILDKSQVPSSLADRDSHSLSSAFGSGLVFLRVGASRLRPALALIYCKLDRHLYICK